MGFWHLEEARLVQVRSITSGAGALFVNCGSPGVPQGKVWIVTAARYLPSVAETQVVSFEKSNGTQYWALLNPVSLNLNPGSATFIEQGMEYVLFPGEYIIARRVACTAGSSMTVYLQIIEIDLPLYTYEEPQIVKRTKRAISSIRQSLAGGGGYGGGAGSGGFEPPGGGREGGGVPVL